MDITAKEKRVIIVLGKRGSGKSFLVKNRLLQFNRYLVYDTLGEYTSGVVFTGFDGLCDFWSKHVQDDFRLIYQPLNPEKEFDDICALVYACGGMVFVVEEIDRFCDSLHLTMEFANIVQRGRHRNITLIALSQRPYRVNRTLSSQAKEMYTFQMSEPRDIDFISEFVGQDLDKVRTLPEYHYLHWLTPGKIDIGKE